MYSGYRGLTLDSTQCLYHGLLRDARVNEDLELSAALSSLTVTLREMRTSCTCWTTSISEWTSRS
ncbi:hypothetical protein SESBI_45929 [Sesbania bispinosa]|nr:hypothetical protein SESBI_45929 [Sesbania bispinosa]